MPPAWAGLKPITLNQGGTTQTLAAISPELKVGQSVVIANTSAYNGSCLHYCKVCPHDEVYPWALGDREAKKMFESERKAGRPDV